MYYNEMCKEEEYRVCSSKNEGVIVENKNYSIIK